MPRKQKNARRTPEKGFDGQSRDEAGLLLPGHTEGGAPEKPVNWDTVKKLIGLGCTGKEIAGFLDIGYSTLARRCKDHYGVAFDDYIKSNKAAYRVSLRRAQYLSAMGEKTTVRKRVTYIDPNRGHVEEVTEQEVYLTPPSITMQIWLGKNELGQTDRQEITERHEPGDIDWQQVPLDERRRIIKLMENARRK